ncbi:MAG: hypothetical protein COA75_07175 [Cellvibrionales bacterium]|nr:MAG: hypothetical protein COA75_07175 [Cellvibrionales bacterium]
MGDIQFSLIKKHSIVFAALLFIAVLLVGASVTFKKNLLDEEAVIKKQIRSLRVKTANIVLDKSLIDEYQLRYLALVDQGFFSEEKRLSWIEQLEVTSSRLVLPDVSYNIDAQQEIKQGVFSTPPGLSLLKSQFTFQSSLLHEGDLLSLMADLTSLDSGLLIVDHCELTRAHKAGNNGGNKTALNYHFRSLCDVSWFTAAELVDSALPLRKRL